MLYDLYKDRVYSVSLYFFHGDRAVASDVTQQVFLKVTTSIQQFRGDAEFSTWLYRLVVNACMDVARSRKSDAVIADRSRMEAFAAPGFPGGGLRIRTDGELGAGGPLFIAASCNRLSVKGKLETFPVCAIGGRSKQCEKAVL